MPSKVPLATLAAVAKREGYTGDPLDAAKIKSHLANHPDGAVEEIEYEGETFAVKDLDFTPDAKPARKLKAEKQAATTGADATDDLEEKVEAMVKDRLKRLGLVDAAGKAYRPGVVDPDITTISAKSGDERMYEEKIKSGTARFKTYEHAMLFTHWAGTQLNRLPGGDSFAAASHEKQFAQKYERVVGKAYSTTSVTQGAATVPDLFKPELIRLVDEYGAFSMLTQVVRTNQPKVLYPRRTGGLTAYWPEQNSSITESTGTYDNVALDAKTVAVLCTASMQLLNDSGLNMADEIAKEMALAIAQIKDQCLLIGDGTGPFGGMTGFDKKFGVAAGTTGYAVTGGDSTSAHTQAQLAEVISRLPAYALRNAKWTCTPAVAAMTFGRLATSTAVGGLTYQDLTGKFVGMQFLGFPIVLNNVMNTNLNLNTSAYASGFTAGDGIDILFGDFSSASKMLDLLNIEIAASDQRGFEKYQMYFRAVARFHSVVHDIGNSTTAGPVVSFWQT